MNTSTLPHKPAYKWPSRCSWRALLAGLVLVSLGGVTARAVSPAGCTGSGLGISLYASARDVHIGDPIQYSALVFNTPFPACDASGIVAGIVTPDGVTNMITLRRTTLLPGESDYYTNVVTYIVRAQDIIQPGGIVRATAFDEGDIHQNEVPSRGGGFQGLNAQVNTPCIQVTAVCTGSAGETGAISFTGTVKNCGNVALTGVTVSNLVNNTSVLVLGPSSLNPNQELPFSGTWIPANPCSPSTATFTAQGTDSGTTFPKTVTSTVSTTCANTLAPSIQVTKTCPTTPVAPGQPLVFSGTVRNTGNVTLTDIVVVNDQPAPNTPVFTLPSLAPGEQAPFTGSYTAPVACSSASTLTATAKSVCGAPVSSSASATCEIVTTPRITVTVACPATPAVPGGVLSYSGTVRNDGDVTLNNVLVVSDRPAANTTLFTAASLAPGASANFTGQYTVPASAACSVTANVTATGTGACSTTPVSDTKTITCPITTRPGIAVTLACPTAPAGAGGTITYTGTVRNTGDVILNDVVVVNNQPAPNTKVFSVLSLAPGASANFTASFTAPADVCSVTSTVTATGTDACSSQSVSNTATATCPLVSAPQIAITQECPAAAVGQGGVLTYTGTVRNTGNVTLTNVVVLNDRTGTTPVFTAPMLAPGASAPFTGSYQVPANACSVSSTVSVTAMSICGVPVSNSASATCPILSAPAIRVTVACSDQAVSPGGVLTFTGTVRNTGDVTLNNILVVSDRPAANTTLFTAASLAPGASANFTGQYTVPATAVCSVVANVTATGTGACSTTPVTDTAAVTCGVTTHPSIAVTLNCPPTAVATGTSITYTGTVRNTGDATLSNVVVVNNQPAPNTIVLNVPSLDPNASAEFTATFTAPLDVCSVSSTVTATGSEACSNQTVSNTATATCPLVGAPQIAVTQDCPTSPVGQDGVLTFTGSVRNAGNVTLTNVVVVSSRPVSGGGSGSGSGGGDLVAPTAGLVGYWALNESGGNVAVDSSGSGINGTVINATRVTGAVGGALSFNGQNTFVDITNSPTLNFAGAITLSAWIRPNAADGMRTIIGHGYTTSPNGQVVLQIVGGQYGVGSWNGVGNGAYLPVPASDIGNWVHLAGVYTGTSWILYRNAIPVSTNVHPLGSMLVNANWAIGANGGGGSRFFSGLIDEVRIYNRALSADEIKAVANISGGGIPSETTTVFTAASLAPGEVANFTGSFQVPVDSGCSITTTLTATASDRCTGTRVSASAPATCPLLTNPKILVTQSCPAVAPGQNGTLVYTGTVSNPGNVTLSNVVVVNNRPSSNTVVFTAVSLPPGGSANFTGSYTVPYNCCSVWSTVTATGTDCSGTVVTDMATQDCPVQTMPDIVVTKTCPTTAVAPGEMLKYSGTVKNTGNIALVDVTVTSSVQGAAPLLGPIDLMPGETVPYYAAYTTPPDFCGTDTVTAHGFDGCSGAPVMHSVTTTCPVITSPRIAVTHGCPPTATPKGGIHTFTGTVSNVGDVTLANVIVVISEPSVEAPVIGPITLAPGASATFTGSYQAPTCCCEFADMLTATGQDQCSGALVSATSSKVCPLLSTPSIVVNRVCPTTTVPVGGVFAYSGVVRNSGDVVLTNVFVFSDQPAPNTTLIGPLILAPGETDVFSGSYTVTATSDPAGGKVQARGTDICQARTVTATAGCQGAILDGFALNPPTVVNGWLRISWKATPGVTYCVQSKTGAQNAVWETIPGTVTATDRTAYLDDPIEASGERIYRVMVVNQ